jgi:hypothetical protein
LTESERSEFNAALNALKRDTVDGQSKWDLIVSQHTPTLAPGAHWGPAFLPWHREYLLRFEVCLVIFIRYFICINIQRALRQYNAQVSLPYWDTTLDASLPDPRQSMIWTSHLLGNGNGHVVVGPFAYWPVSVQLSGEDYIQSLYRQIGANAIGRLIDDTDLEWLNGVKVCVLDCLNIVSIVIIHNCL